MVIAIKNEIEIVGRERLTPALEIAKKFVLKNLSRPALAYVALKKNGEIQATDSHKAIILKNIHSYKEEVLLDPRSLDLVKGYNFPDLNTFQMVDEKNVKATIDLKKTHIHELIQAFKFFKSNKYNVVKIELKETEIKLSNPILSMTINNSEGWGLTRKEAQEDIIITFDPEYWILALEGFLKFSAQEEIKVIYQGQLRPLVFDNDEMKIMILPLRTY